VLTSIVVTPTGRLLVSIGETLQLASATLDQNGKPLSGVTVSWSTSDAAVASVSSSGQVTAVGNGSATIRATSGSVSGTAAVSVAQVVASVAVTPGVDTLTAAGDSVRISALARDALGVPVAGAVFEWASSDTAVATVDGNGEVMAVASGSAGVEAATDGVADTSLIVVSLAPPPNQPPTAGITAPADSSSFVQGTGVSFAGTGSDPEDGALTGAALVWTSSVDGQIGTGGSFTTSALSVGAHTITLTATDSQGATGSASILVTITAPPSNQPPTAGITAPADSSSFVQGTGVSFAGTGSDPEDGALTGAALVWSSSVDGQIGTGASFTTSALSVGAHTITLTATDSQGATGSASILVTITAPPSNQPPTAGITAPADSSSFVQGAGVTFIGTGSDPEDGALTGAALVWTSSVDGQIGTGASFTTSALSVGAHTITLTATDSQGATGSASILVTITASSSNQAPSANITVPKDGSTFVQGAVVGFGGMGSDPEDGALTGAALVWISSVDGQLGTGGLFSTSALSLGTHTITLTVTDSQGATGSTSISVTVVPPPPPNQAPAVTITAPADSSSFVQGVGVSFAGTGIDPEEGTLLGGALVWTSDLDGQIATGGAFTTTTLSVGTHTITLAATDSLGLAGTASITVMITPPTVATITAPTSGTNFFQGDLVTFTGSGMDPMGGPLTGSSLVWVSDLDGQIGTGISFSTSALSVGSHIITLTATDSLGLAGTATISIGINVPALPGFQIEIQFLSGSGGTASENQALLDAAARWEGLVIGDIPDIALQNAALCGLPSVTKLVDDLLIFAEFVPIDGPGGILGQAGPCAFRSSDHLTVAGIMQFDIDDVAALQASGGLADVFIHEMGHVLGIGTLWDTFGFLQNPSSTSGPIVDTFMNGPRAVAAFDSAGGTSFTGGGKVPVENDNTVFGAGSLNGHWRESLLDNELMTSALNPGSNPLSAISVESLADLGYVVDATGADPYVRTFTLRAGPPRPLIMMHDDIWRGPQAIVYPDGRIVPLPR